MESRRHTYKRRQHRLRLCQSCFKASAGYKRPHDGAQVSDRDHDMCKTCFTAATQRANR